MYLHVLRANQTIRAVYSLRAAARGGGGPSGDSVVKSSLCLGCPRM
jgi:hypothetical protein